MRKTVKLITCVVMILTAVFTFAVPASAASSKVVYKNDFNSSTELDDSMWYVSGGTVEVAKEYGEQFLRCTSIVGTAREVAVNFGPEEIKNVDVSLRMRVRTASTNTDSCIGLFFRSQSIPASRAYAYQYLLYKDHTTLLHFNNHYDTTRTYLDGNYEATVRAGLWYNVKLCLRENRIVMYINGEKITDLENDLYSPEGSFGIMGVRLTFDVDDIVMTQYTGKNLPEPTANEKPYWVGAEGTDETAELVDTGSGRVNFNGIGGEEVDTAVSYVDPNKMTVNSWIAIGLIIAAVLLAASTFFVAFLLVKEKKKNEQETAPVTEATPPAEVQPDKEAEE